MDPADNSRKKRKRSKVINIKRFINLEGQRYEIPKSEFESIVMTPSSKPKTIFQNESEAKIEVKD